VHLFWEKCSNVWCFLDTIDVSHVRSIGVYVIWRGSGTLDRLSTVIFVGHGEIAAGIGLARINPSITMHGPGLLVTWAKAVPHLAPGIAAYLSKQLRPLSADRWNQVDLCEVNLPIPA
jgi:hypothetical protein